MECDRFIEHLRHKNWHKASRALRDIKNLDSVMSALRTVCKHPEFPSSWIPTIFNQIKVCLRMDLSSLETAVEALFASTTLSPLLQDAPVDELKVLLRELAGVYPSVYPYVQMTTTSSNWRLSFQIGLVRVIQEMWQDYLKGDQRPMHWDVKSTSKDALLSVLSVADLDDTSELGSLWQRTEVLLRAAATLHPNDDDAFRDEREWLVVHAIARLKCPTIVLWFALRLFPSQIRTRDSAGNLPVHYAATSICRATFASNGFFYMEFPEELREANMSLIVLLLHRFPEGARHADRRGRLPLSLLLDTRYIDCDSTVAVLVAAAPEALVTRDPTTRLYPFQAAAAQLATLNIVFTLLASNPSSFKYRALSSFEKRYDRLLQENSDLREENEKLRQEIQRLKKELAGNATKQH